MSDAFRAVVVEDEHLARLELCSMLAREPRITVVGEAATLRQACDVIAREQPDVVFLDIQLGKDSSFDILEGLDESCQIIFVTAYNEFAVRAFEVNAVDYLLKPVNPDRLKEAVQRIGTPTPTRDAESPALDVEDRLFTRDGERWRFVRVGDIRCIQSSGDYSRVLIDPDTELLMHKSLREWEGQLPSKSFVRIHRSAIVNLEFVERVEEWSAQTFQVFVVGIDTPLRMSRRYAARLKY